MSIEKSLRPSGGVRSLERNSGILPDKMKTILKNVAFGILFIAGGVLAFDALTPISGIETLSAGEPFPAGAEIAGDTRNSLSEVLNT